MANNHSLLYDWNQNDSYNLCKKKSPTDQFGNRRNFIINISNNKCNNFLRNNSILLFVEIIFKYYIQVKECYFFLILV